jgi:hypothetical protein
VSNKPPRSRHRNADPSRQAAPAGSPDSTQANTTRPLAAGRGVVAPASAPVAAAADPAVIFDAGRQALKVRFLMWLSLVCAAGAVYWGQDLLRTFGTRPADGGVLAPLAVRIAWGGSVAALGLGFAFGMWLYGRYAIREILLIPAERRLRIATYRFVGRRVETFEFSDVTGATARRDRFQATDVFGAPKGISVDAPWLAIRLRGRRWPLVLDLQGLVSDPAQLRAVLHNKT